MRKKQVLRLPINRWKLKIYQLLLFVLIYQHGDGSKSKRVSDTITHCIIVILTSSTCACTAATLFTAATSSYFIAAGRIKALQFLLRLFSVAPAALASSLEVNASLTELNLAVNQIGPSGATAIAKALEVNASMTTVYLGNNNLGNAAKDELCKVAAARASLTIYI